MTDPFRPSFWEELRRRRVVRAVAMYGVTAWVVVQVADVFFPALRMPEWTVTLVAVLTVIGFPIVVAVAWIYERTPSGLQRTDDVDAGEREAGVEVPAYDRGFFLALGLGVVVGMVVVGAGIWVASALRSESDDTPSGAEVVAVLPFETVGDANPTFTEGIHGDVLTRLSGVSGLDVISRGSVLRYRGAERSSREIADELGVGWILRGEVQQAGDQVQVHARLVDARRERQVWAHAYRRELTAANLFDIQREITRQIARALETRFTPREREAAERPTTEDLEAYRLYVQGRGLLSRRTELAMRRATEFFRRALARDPEYAAAWAGLADALTYLETFGFPTPDVAVDANRAAERALELDPDLAEAHFALANLAHAERDNEEATRRAERAIALRPSYSDAYNLLSWIQKQHGEPGAALESAERAVELDPLGSAPLSNLALAQIALGHPDEAVLQARRLFELHPDFSTGRFIEALALYHQGRFAEARPLLVGLEVAWAPDGPLATLALVEAALGDTAAARDAAATLGPRYRFSNALVRAALGDPAPAVDSIAAIERWEYWPTFAVRYFFPAALGPLRADPRYGDILRSVDQSWGAPTD